MLNLINLILGGALLAAGRRLFWLFVGALGFLAGIQLTERLWQGSEGTAIVIALIVGLIFAFLAVFLQRIAIGAAGFFGGGFVLTALADTLGLAGGVSIWIIYIVGGIIGVALVAFLFDWALITLSSLAGATLVVQSLFSQRAGGGLIFFVLVILGLVIQGSVLRSDRQRAGSN
jgi:hypothetical protein